MIFQKIGFGDYFNDACIFFSVALANHNHWKKKSFPNLNLTVAEQRCDELPTSMQLTKMTKYSLKLGEDSTIQILL